MGELFSAQKEKYSERNKKEEIMNAKESEIFLMTLVCETEHLVHEEGYFEKRATDEECAKQAISQGLLPLHYYDTSFMDPPDKNQLIWLDENARTYLEKKY